jgi:putative FmdB family regulatory protein
MPTYQYKCKKCKHIFEAMHRYIETISECPECKSEVQKVYSIPNIAFKGPGFYVNDK